MRFRDYLKEIWVEVVLCLAMATALALTFCQAFHIPQSEASDVVLAVGVTAVSTLPLFCVSFSKRAMALGIPLLVLLFAGGMAVLSACTSTPLLEESYDNRALVYLVDFAPSPIVYLLTRRRGGTAFAFVAGCFACGTVQFLYGMDLIAPTVVYAMSSAVLYVIQGLDRGALSSSLIEAFSGIGFSVGLVMTSAIIGGALFLGVVEPLDPPAAELKLVTKYYALEEVHVTGPVALLHERLKELSTNRESDSGADSRNVDEREQEAEGEGSLDSEGTEGLLGTGFEVMNGLGDPMDAIRYFADNPWVVALCIMAVIACWILVVVIRRSLRQAHMRRWKSFSPRDEAIRLYRYICASFARAELVECGSQTPSELAVSFSDAIRSCERWGDSCEFSHVTEILVKSAYGGVDPSEEEMRDMEDYCRLVPKRILHCCGRLRYIRLFFVV